MSGPAEGAYEFGPGDRPQGTASDTRFQRRRAFSLVLLTLVLPGSAQLAAGNRTVGRVAVRVWLGVWAFVLLLGAGLLVSRPTVLSLLSRDLVLTMAQGVLFALAAGWAVLFMDAWRLAGPVGLRATTRRWLTTLTTVLLVVTTGGLVYAADTVGAGKAALAKVFGGDRARDATEGRYNVLLLGADTGKGRVGTRPDSIQLVSVDADTGRAVTFGFARDTENIDFRRGSVMQQLMPQGWNCGDECMLNGLYTWAEDHAADFPATVTEPGVTATREAVEALSGLDVHYYVMIDLKGFTKMIDAVGGLDIDVKRRTPIGGGSSPIKGWIEPGQRHLDGYHALWYARSRQGSTNYERMARQRCVMTAMVGQLDPQTVLLRFEKIAGASSGLLRTDLPQAELGYFADLVLKTRSQKIKSVNFVPPLIEPWDYDPKVVTDTIARTIEASEKSTEKPATAATTEPTPSPSAEGASEADLSSVCSVS